jgi:hypothetical protein
VSPSRWKVFLWNLYPPFLGAGIRITGVASDWSWLEARLALRWWNRNYVGTLFGGSVYSLCDPFHMVLLINRLGPAYLVRDKGAEVRYLRKGTGTVSVRFELPNAELEAIEACPDAVQERRYLVQVKDEAGQPIAEVAKILHIRRLSPPS